jgi:hypothetical protein
MDGTLPKMTRRNILIVDAALFTRHTMEPMLIREGYEAGGARWGHLSRPVMDLRNAKRHGRQTWVEQTNRWPHLKRV